MNLPHPSVAELLAHRRRELPPAELLAISDHLKSCALCRDASGSGEPKRSTEERGAPAGADYETLSACLDDTLDPIEREIFEADARNHPNIRAQLEDLRRMRADDDRAAAATNIVPFARPFRRVAPLLAIAASLALFAGVALWWRSAPQTNNDSLALANWPDVPADLKTAALAGKLPVSASVRELRIAGGALLAESPASASFALLTPIGEVTRTGRPTLRWTARDGAAAYRVNVAQLSDGQLLRSPTLNPHDLAWTPPGSLIAGERYGWQVLALDAAGSVLERQPAPPQREALFQILDAAADAELQRLEAAHPQAHELLALAYAKAGLLTAAEAQLQALVAANPKAALPVRWLTEIRARKAGQPSAAEAPTATKGAQ